MIDTLMNVVDSGAVRFILYGANGTMTYEDGKYVAMGKLLKRTNQVVEAEEYYFLKNGTNIKKDDPRIFQMLVLNKPK